MSEIRPNLWPDHIDVTSIVPPVVILREQASLLGEKTKGMVRGEVESTQEPKDTFEEYLEDALSLRLRVVHVHTLYLVAPALDNYRYSLLNVRHDFQPYPCVASFHPMSEDEVFAHYRNNLIIYHESTSVDDESQFVEWLGSALSHEKTTRLIHALIFRTQELGEP
jgi:hypothetical protein